MTEPDPYAPPQAVVEDPGQGDRYVLAGRGTRLGAVLLDSASFIVLMAVCFAVGMATGADFSFDEAADSGDAGSVIFGATVIGAVLLFLGVNVYLLVTRGQTLGKLTVGIKIVRQNGERAGFWRILLLRMMLLSVVGGLIDNYVLAGIGSIIGLADPLFIFRDDRRCLHDMIANTIVVDVAPKKRSKRA